MGDNTGTQSKSASIFGPDGKLSAASAATSLKYAKAEDLPSYPSTGGVKLSSAGAAASLAASNSKSYEPWKPSPIPAANKAAMMAKDHKADPLWKPEASEAGSKAAMAAHANPIEVEPLQPKRAPSNKTTTTSAAYDTPEDSHRKALMAANASHNRRRSGSLPTQPASMSSDSAAWALKAATKSHKDGPPPSTTGTFSTGDPGFEAARIQNVAKNNVNRQLYTSAPPVSIEVQEKNRQDTLKASAVAMAQKMYAIQQKQIDEAAGKDDSQALAASRARSSTVTGAPEVTNTKTTGPGPYENLEEAARKLAQERLAKIHDEHAEYRNYYGQTSPNRSKLSMRRRPRRASSAATDDSDEEQSRKIRSQMSIFQSKIAEVDGKKRQQDRDALIQIAHRNVDAQISKMDEKVFQDTGKASPAQMEKWEKSAREKAQRDSDERMQNMGKVHIGGGKYIDQSELDAIAKARLQPTLDDITEKAEKQRARDEEERLEKERKLETDRVEKARAAETAAQVKAETERHKQEERARRDEEKRVLKEGQQADKERRRTEAAAEKERARQEKEEKRKSSQHKPGLLSGFLSRGGGGAAATTPAPSGEAIGTSPDTTRDLSSEAGPTLAADGTTVHDLVTVPQPGLSGSQPGTQTPVLKTELEEPKTTGIADTLVDPSTPRRSHEETRPLDKKITTDDEEELAKSPTQSRVKSWMKVKFSSRGDKQKPAESLPTQTKLANEEDHTKETGNDDVVPRVDSMRDVAMAGKTTSNETDDMYGSNRDVLPVRETEQTAPQTSEVRRRSSSVSSLSSTYSTKETQQPPSFALGTTQPAESDGEQRGRSGLKQRLLKKIKPGKEKSKENDTIVPVASNTTDDEFEEAKDKFEEETLAPPPPLTGENQGVKTMSPKGSRDRSRFTEEL